MNILTMEHPVEPMASMKEGNPPEPMISDYVQLGYLVVFFIAGAPLNLAAFSDISSQRPRSHNGSLGRLYLLKRHLNISDLLVVMVYAPTQACWLLTYDWRAGDVMCKIIKFSHSLSFQISSNIIVCIALDRLFSVLYPRSVHGERRVKILLALAWIVAILMCLPQLFIWKTFEPYKDWHQCVTIWLISEWNIDNSLISNGTMTGVEYDKSLEQLYYTLHIVFVFWAPLVCIGLCYLIVLCWLSQNSARTSGCHSPRSRAPTLDTEFVRKAVTFPRRKKDLETTVNDLLSPNNNNNNNNNETTTPSTCVTYLPEPGGTCGYGSGEIQVGEEKAKPLVALNGNCLVTHHNIIRKRKAIRISLLLVSVYIACWLPYSILSMWELFAKEQWKVYSDQLDFIHGLVVLNSVINPFLYGMFGGVNRYTRNG